MRQAHLRLAEADRVGAASGLAVEIDKGLAAPVGQDLDLPPGDAANAGAEGLHHRLLGSEACRELVDAAVAIGDLELGVDASQEALWVTRQSSLHALDLDGVDAGGEGEHRVDSKRSVDSSQRAAGCGRKASSDGRPRMAPLC